MSARCATRARHRTAVPASLKRSREQVQVSLQTLEERVQHIAHAHVATRDLHEQFTRRRDASERKHDFFLNVALVRRPRLQTMRTTRSPQQTHGIKQRCELFLSRRDQTEFRQGSLTSFTEQRLQSLAVRASKRIELARDLGRHADASHFLPRVVREHLVSICEVIYHGFRVSIVRLEKREDYRQRLMRDILGKERKC